MIEPSTTADVFLWGAPIGSVTWDSAERLGHFHYSADFQQSGMEVAPVTMPLAYRRFAFPELNATVFKGLPGFLADSLPDKFGDRVIRAWLALEGREALNPVERLRLIGTKGMGALEYAPPLGPPPTNSDQALDLDKLVNLINILLADSSTPTATLKNNGYAVALQTLLQIGIAADGARAKAVVAWRPGDSQVFPGHSMAPDGLGYWLLKFDGISGNRDREAADPQGYGRIEYAYHLMAVEAGISMSECHLLHDEDRRHFITRRFDRTPAGEKIHRQSLCAMGHMDFDALGTYSYEEAMQLMQALGLSQTEIEEQFRRMLFNVLARNHDDHPKNIAFLMDSEGTWSLSPAYDITFAYNPEGHWTNQHQMTINGKRDHFSYADFTAVAQRFSINDDRADMIMRQVAEAVAQWPLFAEKAAVDSAKASAIQRDLRLHIL